MQIILVISTADSWLWQGGSYVRLLLGQSWWAMKMVHVCWSLAWDAVTLGAGRREYYRKDSAGV